MNYATPGVYAEEIIPEQPGELHTGVPAFLGYAGDPADPNLAEAVNQPRALTVWQQFEPHFGKPPRFLAAAVQGFFMNGGDLCYVVRLSEDVDAETALDRGLSAIEPMRDIDLVCAPDIMASTLPAVSSDDLNETRLRMQAAVLKHCYQQGDRMAILDSLPDAKIDTAPDQAEELRRRQSPAERNGALYFPWVDGSGGFVPPCGHVAGVYARSDRRIGIHKAPANETLEGVADLQFDIGNAEQAVLNPKGVNAIRAFPGRGIRVWGARTLSLEPDWTYINVRRIFLTAGRWIERNLAGAAFEPNDARLWARIGRELTAWFTGLFRLGALKGATPQEAFYIKCDSETNPPEVRDMGQVVTEIGLAPGIPSEFIVVRIVHGAGGVSIAGPTRP